ncbi:hypothetical protein FG386_002768 [Cryptosporidium ryanae]|uniref:uncharacterized protein n=1 Tax=Cryptosporidium ryanae TaxID=515981 RepID=UPI00351A16CB|nr:hypothetical protein FG386_002768 [Cryptosporidium ryanae]
MTKINYIFLNKAIWDPIKNYIKQHNSSVNSIETFKTFIKGISSATTNNDIKDSTRKISDSIPTSFLSDKSNILSSFFNKSFRVMSNLLTEVDTHLTANELPINIIQPKTSSVLLFQRKFIALIMFGAFLGLFPGKIFHSRTPGLCFQSFFSSSSASKHQTIALIDYFNSIASGVSNNEGFVNQHVIFERHYSPKKDEQFFIGINYNIQKTELVRGYMENYNPGNHAVEAIFGNKVVGSAVLRNVMHQEEIMMTVSPETLIARIFHTDMDHEDSISFRGLLRYSSYKGYGSSNYRHVTVTNDEKFGALGRVYTSFDAIPGEKYKQFTNSYSLRELNKLIPGLCVDFYGESEGSVRSPFVSGYWGGGVFGGDIIYKFVIQMIASCVCKRKLVYADPDRILNQQIIDKLEDKYKTCGSLAKALFEAERGSKISKKNAINVLLS